MRQPKRQPKRQTHRKNKLRRAVTRRVSKQSGSGGFWEFILKKPSEIPAQAALFWKSFMKGFGLKTIAEIGNKVREHGIVIGTTLVPLSHIVVWHPVRGPGERSSVTSKMSARKEEIKSFFTRRSLGEPIVLDTAAFDTMSNMKSSDTIDALYVTPQLQVERDTMSKLIKKPENRIATRETIASIKTIIKSKITDSKRSKEPHFYKRCKEIRPCPVKFPLRTSEPFCLISSGQGRVQAIKEVVAELRIVPSQVLLELTILKLHRNLCNLFVMVGNEFRLDGDFDDSRHSDDAALLPTPTSCSPDGPTTEDTLSLFNEEQIAYSRRMNVLKSSGVNVPTNRFDDEE